MPGGICLSIIAVIPVFPQAQPAWPETVTEPLGHAQAHATRLLAIDLAFDILGMDGRTPPRGQPGQEQPQPAPEGRAARPV